MKVDKHRLTTDEYGIIYFALNCIHDTISITIKDKVYDLVS